jgi:phospholipid-binding lipoprotein MlaA
MNSFHQKKSLARRFLVLLAVGMLAGCSGAPVKTEGEIPPQRTVEQYAPSDTVYPIDQSDPIEGFNRGVYRFNAWFDQAIFLPAVGAYDFILPDPVQSGVHNFFQNIGDVENLVNAVLQLKPKASLVTAGRLVVNTTIGLLGIWDPATKMGLHRHDEDFGQTLGRYGVGNGPYLVLPILGPSNLRDTVGLGVDMYVKSEIDPLFFDHNSDTYEIAVRTTDALDQRDNIAFRYFETGSPFEYELVRLMYLKMRDIQIAK